MYIANEVSGKLPYFDGIDVAAVFNGRWFDVSGDANGFTLTAELLLAGGGNVSGEIFADFTADPAETSGIVRASLPDGALHTTFATVTLAAQKVVLTSALTATTLGIAIAFLPCGKMRFRWNPTGIGSIVAGVNKLTAHCQIGTEN